MGITKTFFFAVNFLAISSICLAQSAIFHNIAQGNKKAVKAWIKSKPDLSIMNDQGQTILHAAVMTGDLLMVKTVLKSKIAINILDKQGKTALDRAVIMHNNKMAYQLVKVGGRVTSEDLAWKLKSIYTSRALKFFVVGWFLTPLFWIGSVVALAGASNVMVMYLA